MSPLAGVLSQAWDLYRRYAAHFLVIAFAIYLVTAVIVAVLTAYGGIGGVVAAAIIDLVAAFLLQAALVRAVQDVRDGTVDLDFGQTVAAALPFVLPVGAAAVLAGVGIAIGFALLIVPGFVLLTFWSLLTPAIVIGGSGPIGAFKRSWRTVRGYAWPVFGTYVLVFLIWVACSILIGLITVALPLLLADFVSTVVTGTLIAPYLAIVVTLIYYRLTEAHAGVAASPAAGAF